MSDKIISKVDKYYSNKIKSDGPNSEGVDWNSKESHYLRFDQLTQYLPIGEQSSLLDYGCGYGALIDYMAENSMEYASYTGYDISEDMIVKAQELYGSEKHVFLSQKNQIGTEGYDFVIANGIFNVKLDTDNQEWKQYMLAELQVINQLSNKGFSFNVLTKYSDKEFMRDYLYYADPTVLFDFCKKNFSKYVNIIHDYPLYEFSIVVKK